MAEEQTPNYNAPLVEFSTRLNEIEEKQRLLKDRILLIGENLISSKEDFLKLESRLKKQIEQLTTEIQSIKRLLARIVHEISNLARKPELEILERQMQMFQPLKSLRTEDVKKIVQEELKKQLSQTIKKKKS